MYVEVTIEEAKDGEWRVVKRQNVGIMEVDALLYTMGLPIRAEALESFLNANSFNVVAVTQGGTRYAFRVA